MIPRDALPPYAQVVRGLPVGIHPYLALLPGAAESPALRRVAGRRHTVAELVEQTTVAIAHGDGYAWVDDAIPRIVLMEPYYNHGADLDLYLDLLHELTHVRQHLDGADIWDERFEYVDRPTEIEGYAVAIEEGRRLGMSEPEIVRHVSNPWMSRAEVKRLLGHVDALLAQPL